jgi:hypothetical protein
MSHYDYNCNCEKSKFESKATLHCTIGKSKDLFTYSMSADGSGKSLSLSQDDSQKM